MCRITLTRRSLQLCTMPLPSALTSPLFTKTKTVRCLQGIQAKKIGKLEWGLLVHYLPPPHNTSHTRTHTHTHTYTHTHTHTYTHTHTDTHTDTHTYTQTHTQTHVHTGCHTSMRHNLQAVMISLRTLAATFFSSHACCSATAVKKSTFARHTVSHSLGNWSVCFQHRHKDDEAAVRSRVCAMTQQHAVAEEVRGWASGVDVQGKAPPSTAGSSAYQAIQTLRAGPQFPCTLSPHMPPLGSAPAAPASCSPSHKPQQAEMHVCVCEGGRERERVCVCECVCECVRD